MSQQHPRGVKPGLILTRRVGEVLVVELPPEDGGHTFYISCVQIDRNQVKVGVNCPRSWSISRGELVDEFLAPQYAVHHNPNR